MAGGKKAGGPLEGRDARGRCLPGYTPNPAGGGRPGNRIEALIKGILEEERDVKIVENGKEVIRKMPMVEALVRQYLQRASSGDRHSFRDLLDRGYGKPKQQIDIGGTDGEGIQIIINGLAGGNGKGNGDGKGNQ